MRIIIERDPRRALGFDVWVKQTSAPLPPEMDAVIVEARQDQYDAWFRARMEAETVREELGRLYREHGGTNGAG